MMLSIEHPPFHVISIVGMFYGPDFIKRGPMKDDPQDFPNDPFDDELDAAVLAAAELIARTKRVGLAELELPLVDENCTWIVTVKRMGVKGLN
jgi:hypothetical protein